MKHHPTVTIARYTLLESVRNRLFILALFGVMALSGLTLFIGGLEVTEAVQTQRALTAMLLRLFAAFVICAFVISSAMRELQDKGLELIIALPISRHSYVAGKMLGFCLFGAALGLIVSLPLALASEPWSLVFWCASLIGELSILAALSLLCAISLSSVTSAFCVVIGAYFLSRTIDTIRLIGESPIVESATLSHQCIMAALDFIALLLPALDQFSKTEWLVYPAFVGAEYLFVLTQTVVYLALLFAAACFDLYRKNL